VTLFTPAQKYYATVPFDGSLGDLANLDHRWQQTAAAQARDYEPRRWCRARRSKGSTVMKKS
jgi:hypothetical protein